MSKAVFKAEELSGHVLNFEPQPFKKTVPEVARNLMANETARKAAFRISPLVAEQTGLADIEKQSIESRVEALALSKMKQIQEEAYAQAHELGMRAGHERAYREKTEEIKARISRVDEILHSLEVLKTELVLANESHIVRTILELTKRLTFSEVGERKDRILPVLREAIETAQSEENVTVKLSNEDYDFLTEFKEKTGKEFEFIKKLKLEKAPEVRPGGCIVDTNYGRVDASIEERISKLWDVISEKIPKPETSEGT